MTTEAVALATLQDYDFGSAQNLAQIWLEEGVENPDFPRLKVPAGGGTTWEIADDPSFAPSRELRGIVVAHHKSSRLYLEKFENATDDAARRPDAWSTDGKTQVIPPETWEKIERINAARAQQGIAPLPAPSTDLAQCPFNKFAGDFPTGTTPLGATSGKDNNEYRELYIVLSGAESVVPYQLSLPASSLKGWDGRGGYSSGLGTRGIRLAHVETVLTLHVEKGPGSVAYSVVDFNRGRHLDPQVKAASFEFSNGIKAFVVRDPFLLARVGSAPALEAPAAPVAALPAPVHAAAPAAVLAPAEVAPVPPTPQNLDAAFAAAPAQAAAPAPVAAPAAAPQAPAVDPGTQAVADTFGATPVAPAPAAAPAPVAPAPVAQAAVPAAAPVAVAAGSVDDVDF